MQLDVRVTLVLLAQGDLMVKLVPQVVMGKLEQPVQLDLVETRVQLALWELLASLEEMVVVEQEVCMISLL